MGLRRTAGRCRRDYWSSSLLTPGRPGGGGRYRRAGPSRAAGSPVRHLHLSGPTLRHAADANPVVQHEGARPLVAEQRGRVRTDRRVLGRMADAMGDDSPAREGPIEGCCDLGLGGHLSLSLRIGCQGGRAPWRARRTGAGREPRPDAPRADAGVPRPKLRSDEEDAPPGHGRERGVTTPLPHGDAFGVNGHDPAVGGITAADAGDGDFAPDGAPQLGGHGDYGQGVRGMSGGRAQHGAGDVAPGTLPPPASSPGRPTRRAPPEAATAPAPRPTGR